VIRQLLHLAYIMCIGAIYQSKVPNLLKFVAVSLNLDIGDCSSSLVQLEHTKMYCIPAMHGLACSGELHYAGHLFAFLASD